MENDNEALDSTTETETTENTESKEDLSNEDSELESLRKKVATLDSQRQHWKKKAEEKNEGGPETKPESKELSTKDTLALIEHKVSSEDFDEVIRVAKILGKPIVEALKDKTLISILQTRAEERTTALATQTGSARGTSAMTADTIIAKAEQGEFPETDEGIAKLVEARMQKKLESKK